MPDPQGQANIEQVLDVPVELHGIPEALVITEQNADELTPHWVSVVQGCPIFVLFGAG